MVFDFPRKIHLSCDILPASDKISLTNLHLIDDWDGWFVTVEQKKEPYRPALGGIFGVGS
jgi:hypothetical protein